MIDLENKYNNFNAIRFFSAFQVMYFHTVKHLNLESNNELILIFEKVLRLFPGVTIFFFISGFLISHSYSKNDNYKTYALNRFLRIYPALWACLGINIIILIAFGIINGSSVSNVSFWKWIIAQVSFLQLYTPTILRSYGNGTPNGSLWTIPVELQFYFLLPFLLFLFNKISRKLLLILLIGSYISFALYSNFESNDSFQKIFTYSIIPSLWYFLIGVLFYQYREFTIPIFEKKWIIWLGIYLIFEYILKSKLGDIFLFHLFSRCLLAIFVFTLASQTKPLKLFVKHDLSYGYYLYHMVCINVLVQIGFTQSWIYFFYVLICTFTLSYLSWNCIEKKCLDLKKN